jgi:hypothetical protein
MKEYYDLQAKKQKADYDIKQHRQKLHKKFVEHNKTLFLCLDIIIGLIILMNFGALAITNSIVVHKNVIDVEAGLTEPTQYNEVNPTVANQNNYEIHPEATSLLKAFLIRIFYWAALLGIYIYYRRNVFTEEGLFILLVVAGFYFIALGSDFFNNVGYWLGEIIFRGG